MSVNQMITFDASPSNSLDPDAVIISKLVCVFQLKGK